MSRAQFLASLVIKYLPKVTDGIHLHLIPKGFGGLVKEPEDSEIPRANWVRLSLVNRRRNNGTQYTMAGSASG